MSLKHARPMPTLNPYYGVYELRERAVSLGERGAVCADSNFVTGSAVMDEARTERQYALGVEPGMKVFWGALVAGNAATILLFWLDRCGCGVLSFGEVLLRYGPWAAIFGLAFALLSLPVGLIWWTIDRRWGVWRPLSVPKMMLASGLIGSCVYGFIDHKWSMEERAAMSATADRPQ
jgi:hypothetical protein